MNGSETVVVTGKARLCSLIPISETSGLFVCSFLCLFSVKLFFFVLFFMSVRVWSFQAVLSEPKLGGSTGNVFLK